MKRPPIHGLMAEFDSPTELVRATQRAHDEGYRKMDAYTPFPIEELSQAIGFHHTRLPLVVLIGGILGCLGGYGLQYWVAARSYLGSSASMHRKNLSLLASAKVLTLNTGW